VSIRAIVLENEPASRDVLLNLVRQYCPRVEVLGTASTVDEARALIVTHSPDLLFLDIELDQGTSLSLFTYFSPAPFNVIFTTAHREYALQAIKASCLDYLMKPVDFRELQLAVAKHDLKNQLKEQEGRLQNLILNLHQPKLQRIAIPLQDGYVFCSTDDIIMCQADGNYTHLQTISNGRQLSSRTLGDFEELLPAHTFFRSHKSFLVNLDHVQKYSRDENQIWMKGDFVADLATRRREAFFVSMNPNGKSRI
jgi:two-component system LytT family response regulator